MSAADPSNTFVAVKSAVTRANVGQMRRRVFELNGGCRAQIAQWQKLTGGVVVRKDLTSFDFIDPSMEFDLPVRQRNCDGRVGLEILELHQDILFDGGIQTFIATEIFILGSDNAPR